jgi:hypothetical protein
MSLTFLDVSDVFVASDELDVSDELSVLLFLNAYEGLVWFLGKWAKI